MYVYLTDQKLVFHLFLCTFAQKTDEWTPRLLFNLFSLFSHLLHITSHGKIVFITPLFYNFSFFSIFCATKHAVKEWCIVNNSP